MNGSQQYQKWLAGDAAGKLAEIIDVLGSIQSDFATAGMVGLSHDVTHLAVEVIELKQKLETKRDE